MLGVENVIQPAIETVLKKWPWDDPGGLRAQTCYQIELSKSAWLLRQRGVFALTLKSKKAEELIFFHRSAHRPAEPLTRIGNALVDRGVVRGIGNLIIRIKGLVTEEPESRTVDLISARLGDHVGGGARRAAVHR